MNRSKEVVTKLELPPGFSQDLPTDYDIRDYFPQTPIRNQNPCSACYAFAVVSMVENLGNMLAPFKDDALTTVKFPGISLSVQSIVDCSLTWDPYTSNHGCRGGNVRETFNLIRDNGLVSWDDYPYFAEVSFIIKGIRKMSFFGNPIDWVEIWWIDS